MKCPYKSATVHEKRVREASGDFGWRFTNQKEAYRTTHDFGECDETDCPYYKNGACRKVEKEINK